MKGAAKVFNALSIIFVVILIFWIVNINFGDLSFKENRSAYFGTGFAFYMIFALQFIKRSVQKNHK